MPTSTLARTATAIALVALASLGTAACTGGGGSHASSAQRTPHPGASARPSSTAQAGVTTTMQCLELEGKLAGSAATLQSALGGLSGGGDPSGAVSQLQGFQQQLDSAVGKVTDPALKPQVDTLKSDYDALVSTAQSASEAYSTRDVAAAQAAAAKLAAQQRALKADLSGLQQLCS